MSKARNTTGKHAMAIVASERMRAPGVPLGNTVSALIDKYVEVFLGRFVFTTRGTYNEAIGRTD